MLRRVNRLTLLSLLLLSAHTAPAADEAAPVFTDPALAGPDYAVQGEYSGEIRTDDGAKKIGVQVIALGDGKFQAVSYVGGLPGDGWDKGERFRTEGSTADGVTTFSNEHAMGVVKDGNLTVSTKDGVRLGDLPRASRASPTLGQKPPEGAVVLFDGTSADAFEGGRLSDDGLLMPGVTSKQKFKSCTLHVEFCLPFQPTAQGQARGNSGCYLQGRYEVQMLDSFGLEGKDNECGGIYSIKDPDLNMCFPPLTWQTYDIDYTAAAFDAEGKKTESARMTVRHNGVVVHDNVELTHGTTAAPVAEGPDPGPIYLQDHGNPVRYRNIWLVER